MQFVKQTPDNKQKVLVQDIGKPEKGYLVFSLLFVSDIGVQVFQVEQQDGQTTVNDRVVESFERQFAVLLVGENDVGDHEVRRVQPKAWEGLLVLQQDVHTAEKKEVNVVEKVW